MDQEQIVHWARELKTLELKGAVICTLMTAEPGRYPTSICTCSMPKTREQFFTDNTGQMHCSFGVHCKPAVLLPAHVETELHEAHCATATPNWPQRPRGFWTAALRR